MRMPTEEEIRGYLELIGSTSTSDESNYLEGGQVAKLALIRSPLHKYLVDAARGFMYLAGDVEAYTAMFLTGFQMGRHFEGRHKEALDFAVLRAEIDTAVPGMVLR